MDTVDDRSIEVLYGRDTDTGDWGIASYRLPVDEWTEAEAKAFCEEHDGIKFEPATGSEESDSVTDDAASDTATPAALDTARRSLRLQRNKLRLMRAIKHEE